VTVPGSHVIRQGDHRTGLSLEVEGYEIRDCVHVVTTVGVEQWWLARWPFPGNTIQNLLKHRVGALDIERCRVGLTVETWPSSRNYGPGQKQPGGFGKVVKTGEAPAGRWPPNLVFLHAEGCRKVGEKQVGSIAGGKFSGTSALGVLNDDTWNPSRVPKYQYADPDGKETVPEYECVEGCPVATLDVMSGVLTTNAGTWKTPVGYNGGKPGLVRVVEQDSGGASRFFPCFKARDELQAWFDRLLAVDPV
jgi:hypothetical protein